MTKIPIDTDTAIAILAGNFATLVKQFPADLLARRLEPPCRRTCPSPEEPTPCFPAATIP